MKSMFKKIDIFGTSVQLSFQHDTHHKTCCGSIFTLFLVAIFAVAFWIEAQDVIYKNNPNINFNTNAIQSPILNLAEGQLPIAFGLRTKSNLQYIKSDLSTSFNAQVSIKSTYSNAHNINEQNIPVSFVECSTLFQDSSKDNFSLQQKFFLDYIQLNMQYENLYCIQFDKNNSYASNFLLQSQADNKSVFTIEVLNCISTNCIDKQYQLSQLNLDTIFLDHNQNFSDFEKPLLQTVSVQSHSFISGYQKQVSLYFQYTEIETQDNLFFNGVTQLDQALTNTNKILDIEEIDQSRQVLLTVQFQLEEKASQYRRQYTKLSAVVAEIGGLAKALIYIFGMVVTPFAKINFQTSLMNEIFCFEDDEELEKQKSESEEQQIIQQPDLASPVLSNKHKNRQNDPKNYIAPFNSQIPQIFGQKRDSGGQIIIPNSQIHRLQSLNPSINDMKQQLGFAQLASNQIIKQENNNSVHDFKKMLGFNFMGIKRSSLKKQTVNTQELPNETTQSASINKIRKSDLPGLPAEFETPYKLNGSNNLISSNRQIQTENINEIQQNKKENFENETIQNNINNEEAIENQEIKFNFNNIQINTNNDEDQIENQKNKFNCSTLTQKGNLNNFTQQINYNQIVTHTENNENNINNIGQRDVKTNQAPLINLQNVNQDLNNSTLPQEQSPIKKQSISKKMKRNFTADQNYISSLLHVYQENQDPDSAKLKKRKSLRKQGDWFFKKIFTPKTGGLIFKAYEYILYFLPFGKIKKKRQQLRYTLDKINDRLDAVFIINKLIEIDKLKMLILNENQLKLFDYMPKPVINNKTQYQHQLKTQQELQLENMNMSTQKGLSLKLKPTNQPEESKFKSTWSILDSEKTTLMKAHEAYLAFNKIKDDSKDISEIDEKLLSMLDPQILSYFEKTRQQKYYLRMNENSPANGGFRNLADQNNNFQTVSNQYIQQPIENLQKDASIQNIQQASNDNLEQVSKVKSNLKIEQNKSLFRISQDNLVEESRLNNVSKPTLYEISPEKNSMLNESIEIAHESYLQNKTVFTEFMPTKNIN
ncbi:transmembrane protein, putative (macronuclear) [Tetrahymena thermophila SB210]|uniref:Transmembrane protein, putative n=1 Tax=Tetrahymena thermophila (strain SB210) TaxID=312017 RepID=I7MLQ4_TETTS|nr:transmembrane protein, putative [Tetrahymena thermophila SB210]EAS02864.2 transmembrane protein, putative [Tetrahymena thermophila SB210]|eukprot:XP_001023109.2 transmembrane protein, putative [Tetrahymena thermophila SB210]